MAHVVRRLLFCKRTPLAHICREGTPLQTQGLPQYLVPLPLENGGQQAHVFLALPPPHPQ